MTWVGRSVGKMRGTEHTMFRSATAKNDACGALFRVRIFGQASAGCGCDWTAYGRQPIVAVGFVAAGQSKKFVL
jgi:hypothetical protein